MSRPILSRPRTRVYGCNYDKGESYYKPMVDHLDRKYSSRPLFSEPRNSLADEIAARRSDIGSRGDLAGPRSSGRDLDLEFDSPRPRTHAPPINPLLREDEETVYDIRGQRSSRRSLADDFASEIASTTRRFKAHSSIGLDDSQYSDFRRSDDKLSEASKNARIAAKSAFEEAEGSFKRRSKLLGEEMMDRIGEEKSALTRWSKLAGEDNKVESAAAGRAKQTKARLNDLEFEMEEMAERQAKRERRAAALRALVSENSSSLLDDQFSQQQSSLSSSSKRVSKYEHEAQLTSTGTRSLADSRIDESIDDLDFFEPPRRGPTSEDDYEEDFVTSRRRVQQRATEAFERDLAELRQKRRDMQDKMFDMIDIKAEIERAKTMLDGANTAFLRHATKFDNSEPPEPEVLSLAGKIDRNRKIQAASAFFELPQETPKPKGSLFKWSKMTEIEKDPPGLVQGIYNRRARINSIIADEALTNPPETISEEPLQPPPKAPKERSKKKRSFIKRKKSVSF